MMFGLTSQAGGLSAKTAGTADGEGEFQQIFNNMFKNGDSDTDNVLCIAELAEVLGTNDIQLSKNFGKSISPEKIGGLLDKINGFEGGGDFAEQLAEVIPVEILQQFENSEQIISKLNELQGDFPQLKPVAENLKGFIGSNQKEVDNFLQNLRRVETSVIEKQSSDKGFSEKVLSNSGNTVIQEEASKRASGNSLEKFKSGYTEISDSNKGFNSKITVDNLADKARNQSKTLQNDVLSQKGEFSQTEKASFETAKQQLSGNFDTAEQEISALKNGVFENNFEKSKTAVKPPENPVKNSNMNTDFNNLQASQIYDSVNSQEQTSAKQVGFNSMKTDISRQVSESIETAVKDGIQRVKVNLNPPELGKIVIKLEHNAGQLSGKLEVSSPQTKVEIEKALAQVVQELKNSGITISKPNIVLTDNNSSGNGQGYEQSFAGTQFGNNEKGQDASSQTGEGAGWNKIREEIEDNFSVNFSEGQYYRNLQGTSEGLNFLV